MSRIALLLVALVLLAATPVAAAERLRFPALGDDTTTLDGYLRKPSGPGPFPAVVLAHGCGGVFRQDGVRFQARDEAWMNRLVAAGFLILMVDSFNPRGQPQVCTIPVRERRIDPWRHRGSDVEAARRVLAARPDVLADRIGLLGWSHGGSTVLAAVDVKARHVASDGGDFTVAIAFYPGCLVPSRRGNWDARVETLILMGEDDDWTPPGPCVAMVDRLSAPARVSIRLYPGAVHGFDGEGTRVITRTGLITPSGSAKVGPHPEARADAIGRTLELLKARLAN